ncbi:MAG: DNA repair protein RecO [Paludibacteraceae bacterium]|nr:DNA repair protein RecO [Paludibacteraceae bacterium]
MFQSGRAIVLHTTHHTDKTTLIHIYSRELGRICTAVSGLHGKRSNTKSALFTPLALLQVTLQIKNSHIRIQEATVASPNSSIATHHGKRTIAFFIAEFLTHCLQEQDADEELFDYLCHTIQLLEEQTFQPDFHLHLMMYLTHHLGFFPNIDGDGDFFDLINGIRRTLRPNHPNYLSPSAASAFFTLCQSSGGHLNLTRTERQELLNNLLHYYQLHLPYFGKLKSVSILQELFD